MFTNVSRAGIGLYITVIVGFLRYWGLDLDDGQLTEAVFVVLQGIGAVLWIVGQLLRRDLMWGIFRK